MAKITLTVADLDLAAGTYNVDFLAEGTEIDDGQATAAYFTGFYLNTIINTPEFLEGVLTFGRDLIDQLTRDGDRPMTQAEASSTIILTDKNLKTGRISVTQEWAGGDPTGESLPTTAQVAAGYMRFLLGDVEFRDKVWAFAEEFVANYDTAEIPNNENDADSLAA